MAIVSRSNLKKSFKTGNIPTQEDFENLIDSVLHKKEDGLISTEEGLKIYPSEKYQKFISLYYDHKSSYLDWSLEKYPRNAYDFGLNLTTHDGMSKMIITQKGNVGLGILEPKTRLDVDGSIQCHGRRGTFVHGKVPADKQWHVIIPSLNECNAFEIIAKTSKAGKGMHSMLYAIALSTFNGKRSDISMNHAYYENRRDKMKLRWTGNDFNYNLEICTKRDFGDDVQIQYYVTKLWW